ncbi:MAG: polysaccharide deacetylase family protein [Rhizobiaceae bacterium]
MTTRVVKIWLGVLALIIANISIAHACMGISRTINLRTFQTYLGAGPSGGIGLRKKEVVLTFDDGPNSATTPRVLTALANECTKATFFVVGEMARANPKLLQRMARSGHTIAHHTQRHRDLTHASLADAQRNIAAGIYSVRAALGPYKTSSTKLFRYPYLARNAALDGILKRKKLLSLSAEVMSQDWKSGTGEAMVARVMRDLKTSGGGVILLHDIQPKTASALPLLLRRLKQGGYKIVHLRSGGSGRHAVPVASLSRKKRPSSKRKIVKRKLASLRKKTSKPQQWSLFGEASIFKNKPTGSISKKKRKTVSRVRVTKKKKSLFRWANEASSSRVNKSKARPKKKKLRRRKKTKTKTARKPKVKKKSSLKSFAAWLRKGNTDKTVTGSVRKSKRKKK